MSKIPFGPTYDEMLNPSHVDPETRARALKALKENELDPINLFNITWKNEKNEVNKIVLPKALTGVDANIVVMLGKYFPSGSHKVGPAYATLIEGCVDGEIIPGKHTILGPSTGNFGIGTSYITNLMKYDAIVIEDLAYFCMDFRKELSKPFEPPYQSTVAKYTDRYILMMSGSKIFSYAGERIAIVAFSNKMFDREYPRLRQLYGLGKMGDNYVLTYLYAASSGTSHSAQYALSAMMKASVEGKFDFVKTISEYGRRAKVAKEIFDRNGFSIVYDKDGDMKLADGFYFTIGYQGMDSEQLLTGLLRCGISAMALDTTGSSQPGIRACVSTLSTDDDMKALDERLALFVKLQNEES